MIPIHPYDRSVDSGLLTGPSSLFNRRVVQRRVYSTLELEYLYLTLTMTRGNPRGHPSSDHPDRVTESVSTQWVSRDVSLPSRNWRCSPGLDSNSGWPYTTPCLRPLRSKPSLFTENGSFKEVTVLSRARRRPPRPLLSRWDPKRHSILNLSGQTNRIEGRVGKRTPYQGTGVVFPGGNPDIWEP